MPNQRSVDIQAMNQFSVQLQNAGHKSYILGLPSRETNLKFIPKDNSNLQYPITLQANKFITDLYFNSRINRDIILLPNQQLSFQNLLFYHPSHSQFNATLFVKNSYSQFQAISIRAKPIKLKVTPKYIGYFRCSFIQKNNIAQIPLCKIVEEKYQKSFIEFSIHKEDLIRLETQKTKQSQSVLLSPMNRYHLMLIDLLRNEPIITWFEWIKYDKFLPKKVKNQHFIMPRVMRKIIFENQSGIFLKIKSISFADLKCQDEFFIIVNCHRKNDLQIEPMRQFQILMYTKMQSVFTHGISWLYIQTDKLEFETQILYTTDYQVLRIKNELSSQSITAKYIIVLSISLFASAYVTFCCIKLLVDSYIERIEAQSNFWNLVQVNEAANNDTIFWIQYKPYIQRYPFEQSQIELKERRNQKSQNAVNKKKKKKKNFNVGDLSMDQNIVSGRDEPVTGDKFQEKRVQSQPENQIKKIEIKNSQIKKIQNLDQTDSIGSSDTLQSYKIETRSFSKIKKTQKSRESSIESNKTKEFNKDLNKQKVKKEKIRRSDSTQSDQTLTTKYSQIKLKEKKQQKKLDEKEEKKQGKKLQEKHQKNPTYIKKEQIKQKNSYSINKYQQVKHHRQMIVPANLIQTTPKQTTPRQKIPNSTAKRQNPPKNRLQTYKANKYTPSHKSISNQDNLQWVYDQSNPNELLEIPKQIPDKQQNPRYHQSSYMPVSYRTSTKQPIYQKKIKSQQQQSYSKYQSTSAAAAAAPTTPTTKREHLNVSKTFQSQDDFPELGGFSKPLQKQKLLNQQQKANKGRWQSMIDTISTLNKKTQQSQEKKLSYQIEQSLDKKKIKKFYLQDKKDSSKGHGAGQNIREQSKASLKQDVKILDDDNDDNDDDDDYDDEQEEKALHKDYQESEPNIWTQMVPSNSSGKAKESKYHSLFGTDSEDDDEDGSSQEDALSQLRKASSKIQKTSQKYKNERR